VCHSDLHVADGAIVFPLPVVAGHEAAGVVETVGEGVTNLAEGDRVVLTCKPSCGECYWCVRGEEFLCSVEMAWATGVLPDGGTRLSHRGQTVYRGIGLGAFAEYVTLDARGAVKLPPDTPLDVAALLGCAVQTGVGAVLNTARVQPGDTVLIVGLGGVGICIAQGAVIAGASRIIGVDRAEARRAQALQFGVDDVLDPAHCDIAASVLELTGGIGIDYAFDAVGAIATTQICLDSIRAGGTAVVVGVADEGDEIPIESRPYVGQGKRLLGCFLGSANPHRDFPLYLTLWKSGRLPLEELVSSVRPLSEINDAFADLRGAMGLRTVLAVADDSASFARSG
jgi:S-(hydroxymethyl)glutathione dehydrogenase/alcohol dehydrogenase